MPIIELTTQSNSNFYFRTFQLELHRCRDRSDTPETVNFTLPAGIPNGNYVLTVIASGIGSTALISAWGMDGLLSQRRQERWSRARRLPR